MNTAEVAKLSGIHKDTLLRWLRAGLVAEPSRDRNNWRNWTANEAQAIAKFAQGDRRQSARNHALSPLGPTLESIDWDFAGAKTDYLTHSLHPYPAKFIPQIPNALIQELSSIGETVLDPFCGSGTTLVEALTLKRHAIGIDANPIACLISRAKTIHLNESELAVLLEMSDPLNRLENIFSSGQISLFGDKFQDELIETPNSEPFIFWFTPEVADELAHIKSLINSLPTENTKTLALAVFASIVVAVSKQDSDTRYVRREKNIPPGGTVTRFRRSLERAIRGASEFASLVEDRFGCQVVEANVLTPPTGLGKVDLVVCSPPYPNAYSYHLYHRTRMLWLGIDPEPFKAVEIGSHRKYSRRGPRRATVDTFKDEMLTVFGYLGATLKKDRYACFVIGDSILNKTIVRNNEVLTEVAEKTDFVLEADILRHLQDSRKSFNPKIGRIKEEHILVFRYEGRSDA